MGEVTEVLDAVDRGEPGAAARLLPLVYRDLRRLAAARLARERPGRRSTPRRWCTRPTSASSATTRAATGTAAATSSPPPPRRCAASSSRRPGASGGSSAAAAARPRPLDEAELAAAGPGRPTTCWPSTRPWPASSARTARKAELVKLRYFSGLSVPAAAEALGISTATAERHWAYARAWLRVEVGGRARR